MEQKNTQCTEKLRVLAVGVDQTVLQFAVSQLKNYELTAVESSSDFLTSFESWSPDIFHVILCGVGWPDLPVNELAQSLKMRFPRLPLYFIALDSQIQEDSNLVKNGFLDCFYYPMDANFLSITLHDHERSITGQTYERFVAVNACDIKADESLNFELNLYLAANNRYIRLNNEGQALPPRLVKNLEKHSTSHVYVKEKQLGAYYKFLAGKIKGESTSSPQMKLAVRRLFHDLLSPKTAIFEEGKAYLNYANQIIAEYVKSPKIFDFHKELLKSTGSNSDGLYERSQKVATICGLISLATGRAKPEDLVIAALLCDLGLSQLPIEIREKSESELSRDEKEIFETHVPKTLSILASKRIVILPEVREAITQHHERYDGKGFPEKMPGYRLSVESQILSFALQFEELMRVKEGQPRVFPETAFHKIAESGSINPDILRDLRSLFVKEITEETKAS
ncbi:MAG: HD domain-containing phosphohydrolase [Pseudobdellovibrio sp.]